MAYTKEQILETYKKLPKDLQDAIFSVDTAEAIRKIGEKHKMMIDKIGILANETGLGMLGLVHPNQFIVRLSVRLGTDKDISREIAQDINLQIFSPVRENLKKIHDTEEEVKFKEIHAEFKPLKPWPEIISPKKEEVPVPILPETKISPIIEEKKEGIKPIGIFEAKTKEGIFHSPAQIVEKPIDPYREPAI